MNIYNDVIRDKNVRYPIIIAIVVTLISIVINTDLLTHPFTSGLFTAEVEYHNPRTGYTATYTLDVQVTDGYLEKIFFNNGGWLDDSHFTPPRFSILGNAEFTSDRGYQYKIHLGNRY